MFISGVSERIGDSFAGDTVVGAEVQQESGVVIDPPNNFGIAPVGEGPVGEI